MQTILGILMGLAVLGLGLFQLATGWAGIAHEYGTWWGVAAAGAGLIFRFTIPLVWGTYLCATEIWGWHPALAALLAAPGLLFMIPALVASVFGAFSKR